MAITANGFDAIEGEIVETLRGPWHARVALDLDEEKGDVAIAVGTSVTIDFEDGMVTFVGTVTRAEAHSGRWIGRIVGGAGGLRDTLEPKQFVNLTAQAVLTDTLGVAGEVLDAATTSADVSTTQLSQWVRSRGQVRHTLAALARELSAKWRVTRAGQVAMVTSETWPVVEMEATELDRDPERGEVIVAPEDAPLVRPGVTYEGDRIAAVTTAWTARGLRQLLVLDDDQTRGAGAQAAAEIAEMVDRRIDYLRMYPAKVISQDAAGNLQVYPDDARIRGSGLGSIPLRHGIPGLVVKVVTGSKVNIYFEDGDPKKPVAGLWPDGSSVLSVEMTATTSWVIEAPSIKLGKTATEPLLKATSFLTQFDTHTHPTPMGPSGTPAVPLSPNPALKTTKSKAE